MSYIPVFVSSTFRDFHGERDVIRRIVKPALDAAAAPLGAQVEFLDLRWGVDTTEASEEDVAQQLVLDVCLSEVDRCRPLFLGLLGDRFGWVPPAPRLAEAMAHIGMPCPPESGGPAPSVTALELWHGLVNGSSSAVIVRRHLAGDAPREWRDPDPSASDWLLHLARQAGEAPDRHVTLIPYEARVTDGRIVSEDLERFAADVVAALGPLVLARARELAGSHADSYEIAASMLTESRRRVFAGRDAALDSVDDLMVSEAFRGAVLSGPSGVGKTSLLIAACDRLRASGRPVASVLVGAGPGVSSTREIVERLASQIGISPPSPVRAAGVAGTGDTSQQSELDDGDRELLAWWGRVLADLDEGVVLAIDGIDGLDPGEDKDDIPFVLPRHVGPRVQYLVSTTSESQLRTLQKRGLQAVALAPLTGADGMRVARDWALASGRRTLPEPVVRVLAERPRTPLWLALSVEELGWLQQDDYRRAETNAGAAPADALVQMLSTVARELPPSESELATRLLGRAAAEFQDRAQAHMILVALGLTRSGLTPGDLQALSGADPLVVSRARWLLGQQLLERDAAGRIGFHHQVMAQASIALIPPADVQLAHQRVAEHLAGVVETSGMAAPDVTALEDCVWHSVIGGRTDLLARAMAQATPGRPMLTVALADVLSEAVLAARSSGDARLEAVRGLRAATAEQHGPAVVGVLTATLARHGRSRFRFHECAALIEPLLGLLDDGDIAFYDEIFAPGLAPEALVVAGETLIDGLGTAGLALRVLHVAAARCQARIAREPADDASWYRLIRAKLAVAELLAGQSRRQDAERVFAEVLGEMLAGGAGRAGPAVKMAPGEGLQAARSAVMLARDCLRRQPDDLAALLLLARGLRAVAGASLEGALTSAIEAEEVVRGLRTRRPDSPEVRELQARISLDVVGLSAAAGKDIDRALLASAVEIADGLADDFPSNEEYALLAVVAQGADQQGRQQYHGITRSSFDTYRSAGPAFDMLKRRSEEDPQRRSLSHHTVSAGLRYASELEESGRPWAAAALRLRLGSNQTDDRGRRIQALSSAPIKQLAKRVLHWPSLFALGNGVLGLGITLVLIPRSAFLAGRGPYMRTVYRDRKTGRARVEDDDDCVRWDGWAPVSSVRVRLAGLVLLQAIATAVVLYLAVPLLLELWSQRQFVSLAAIGAALGWQQFSRGASEWWDVVALPGKASPKAEESARLLLEEAASHESG